MSYHPGDYRNQSDPDFFPSSPSPNPNFSYDPEEFGSPVRPPIVQLALFLAVLFLLAVFACPLLAQTGPPDPLLATATTDCGPRNTAYRINWNIEFRATPDRTLLEAGRLRYGPCFGGGPLCNDLGGKCIETENEAALTEEWLTALMANRCDPPRGSLRPSMQTKHDWTYALLGNRSAMDILRQKYQQLGCSSTPPVKPSGCPSGQSCQPSPCPSAVCPPCPSCPPVPICPPGASQETNSALSSIPPSADPLDVWILPSKTRHQASYWITGGGSGTSKLYLLRSGVGLKACDSVSPSPSSLPCVYAWQLIPSSPEVKP